MLNILIVDDSILVRNNIKVFVEALGHTVLGEADNGIEAISKCKELNPDLITMDITMPDMDGITAIKEIRNFNKDVNIIVVTSHGQEEIIMLSLKAGAKGYILKPMNENNLSEAINSIYNINKKIDDECFLDE